MESSWNKMMWQQLGAAIDMLENAVTACPESLWGDQMRPTEFWYLTYHTLFWMDYYLAESPDLFTPPAPFTLSEMDPSGAPPERAYSQAEMLTYLEYGRAKAMRRLSGLGEAELRRDSGIPRRDMTVAELLIYNTRHVQHHAAQLYFILRRETDSAPKWVSKAKAPL